jgi:flagellar protein FliS
MLGKAIAILGELRSTLDHEVAPELCERLDRLYVFFQEQLSRANCQMDPGPIDPVVRMLGDLREAWAQAVTQVEGAPR